MNRDGPAGWLCNKDGRLKDFCTNRQAIFDGERLVVFQLTFGILTTTDQFKVILNTTFGLVCSKSWRNLDSLRQFLLWVSWMNYRSKDFNINLISQEVDQFPFTIWRYELTWRKYIIGGNAKDIFANVSFWKKETDIRTIEIRKTETRVVIHWRYHKRKNAITRFYGDA